MLRLIHRAAILAACFALIIFAATVLLLPGCGRSADRSGDSHGGSPPYGSRLTELGSLHRIGSWTLRVSDVPLPNELLGLSAALALKPGRRFYEGAGSESFIRLRVDLSSRWSEPRTFRHELTEIAARSLLAFLEKHGNATLSAPQDGLDIFVYWEHPLMRLERNVGTGINTLYIDDLFLTADTPAMTEALKNALAELNTIKRRRPTLRP